MWLALSWTKDPSNMYRAEVVSGNDVARRATEARPFGPEFSAECVKSADCMEVWCSGMMDAGPDYCRFDLKANGRVIASRLIRGY
jgi:hypothetical protein